MHAVKVEGGEAGNPHAMLYNQLLQQQVDCS